MARREVTVIDMSAIDVAGAWMYGDVADEQGRLLEIATWLVDEKDIALIRTLAGKEQR